MSKRNIIDVSALKDKSYSGEDSSDFEERMVEKLCGDAKKDSLRAMFAENPDESQAYEGSS
jgi:hypothetical protein